MGVIVPMLTPFDSNGAIDTGAARRLTDFLIGHGVSGLFPMGTTGEGPLLTIEERRRVAETVVQAAAGRVPVIIHSGAITTRETVALTIHARDIGAQAVAVVPPYFYRLTDEALIHHYERVAGAAPDFPVYLYNNPAVTPNVLTTDLVYQIVERCPNVCGLKDSSGSLATLNASKNLREGAFNTAIGPDGLILAGLAMGLDATVSGNANVVPEVVTALYQVASAGDLLTARKLQGTLDQVRAILKDGMDLSLYKGVLTRRGISVGTVRAPLLPAPDGIINRCWDALLEAGLDLQAS